MKRSRWPYLAVAMAVFSGSVAACGGGSSSTQTSTPSSSGPVATTGSTGTPETTAEPAASSSTDGSAPGASVAPPTVPATSVSGDPCADFAALLGYERMEAVRDGAAPTDPACKPAVDRSAAAIDTLVAALSMWDQLVADNGAMGYTFDSCQGEGTLTNGFDGPVIFWGVVQLKSDGAVTSYLPFITEVIPSGGTATLPLFADDAVDDCPVTFTPFIAPTGGVAMGVDGEPAPDDDPLASDDATVWGPALVEPDIFDWSMADVVNRYADIHSTVVGKHNQDLENDTATPREGTPTFTICGSESADLGPDIEGEYAWLVFASQSDARQIHKVGLFSRGVDRRWRSLGASQVIDEVVDPADPCRLPPRAS